MGLKLRSHQQANLEFFRTLNRAATLLPYGTGKTPILIRRLVDVVPPNRALIVTTGGTVYKWAKELKKWGRPEWKVALLTGKKKERTTNFFSPHHIGIINYQGLHVMLKELGSTFHSFYSAVVFDEIHRARNQGTRISMDCAIASHPKTTEYVYVATGSPVLESPIDLFGVMRAINPYIFGYDFEAWRKRYFERVRKKKADGSPGYPKWHPKPGAIDFLSEQLHKVSFYREAKDCDVNLPEQKFGDPWVEVLRGRTRDLYFKAQDTFELCVRNGTVNLSNVYPRLEKLCQLSRGWAYDGFKRPMQFDHLPGVNALMEWFESIRGQGSPVIWAVRPPDMGMIAGACKRMGLRSGAIYGEVRNMKKRDKIISKFNDGLIDVAILHPDCVGEGINLNANHSFRYSYRWSHNEWTQPMGRFTRYDSTVTWVSYTDLIVQDTQDEGIIQAIQQKRDIGKVIVRKKSVPWKAPVIAR